MMTKKEEKNDAELKKTDEKSENTAIEEKNKPAKKSDSSEEIKKETEKPANW